MSEPFIGQITMFAGTFAPEGWAKCDGQLLPINSYQSLFSLLGTMYGGDGETTFALPDMRGRLPMHNGQAPGLSNRLIGQRFGQETVTLTANENAAHSHTFQASNTFGTKINRANNVIGSSANVRMFRPQSADTNLSSATFSNIGGNQAHSNTMPFQCISFIIALQGVFPSEN